MADLGSRTPQDASRERSELSYQLRLLNTLFSREDKTRYILLLLMMIVGAGLDFVGISLIPALVALLASPERLQSLPVFGGWLTESVVDSNALFLVGSLVLVCVFVVKGVYFLWMHKVQFRLVADHRIGIGGRLFSAYVRAPWTFHMERNSAVLMRNIVVETNEIVQGVLLPILSVVLGGVTSLLLLGLMIVVLPLDCLAVFIGFGLVAGLVLGRWKKQMTRSGEIAKEQRRVTIQTANEGLALVVDAKIASKEKFFVNRVTSSIAGFAEADRTRSQVAAAVPYVMETATVLCILTVLWVMIGNGQTLAGLLPEMAMLGAVSMRLRQSTARVFGGLGQMHFSKFAIGHVVDDVRLLENGGEAGLSEFEEDDRMPLRESIELSEVAYSYPGASTETVSRLSLVIKRGESFAFVGRTGSGKSTVVGLILGILDPDEGTVTVDGHPIAESLASWQRSIGYVPQMIHLLDDTLRSNVAFGVAAEDVDEELMAEVIRLSQLEETVSGLEAGLDTVIGERGVRLSGGQRQRLGIARALYRRPDVLVMDEGTSALDAATEAALVRCIRQLQGQMTMIFVAHRLSTVEHCDRICLLDEGAVVAVDEHARLIRDLPAYSRLHSVSESEKPQVPIGKTAL